MQIMIVSFMLNFGKKTQAPCLLLWNEKKRHKVCVFWVENLEKDTRSVSFELKKMKKTQSWNWRRQSGFGIDCAGNG